MKERAGPRAFLPWTTLAEARMAVETWLPIGEVKAFRSVPQSADWYCAPCRAWHTSDAAMTEDTGPPGNILCAQALAACSEGRAWLPWWEPPTVSAYRVRAWTMNMADADLALHELGRIRYALIMGAPANPFATLHAHYVDQATAAIRERVNQIKTTPTTSIDL